MRTVIIAGGTGTVGQRLSRHLESSNYQVKILTRNENLCMSDPSFIHWDIRTGTIDKEYLSADYVINLSGAGIADQRWTLERKKILLDSRIKSTQLLIDTAIKNEMKLEQFISASAIGYYGDTGAQVVDVESNVVRKEFLSDVCVAWEEEARKASDIARNLSIIRIGTVLSAHGGALEKMDQSIPYGVAAYLGSGKQYVSWIHIDDLCKMILYIIHNDLDGIFNAVSPNPASNKEFMRILKSVLNPRAVLVKSPAFVLKLALGEMSRLVLNSSNISANKILETGFQFDFPMLEEALRDIYNKRSD